MGVTYKKLFKLMIDCGLKKKDLQEMACLSVSVKTTLVKELPDTN